MTTKTKVNDGRVCPWWLIPSFDNPLRRLIHDPQRILAGLVKAGEDVADIGCGMGYFTIPLAQMVGEQGRVWAVDLQAEMLAGLKRRAARAGVLDRITLVQTPTERLEMPQQVDFALAFWMIHETPDAQRFLGQILAFLKPGGKLLVVEPVIHVNRAAYERTMQAAKAEGFRLLQPVPVKLSRGALLERGTLQ
jgi:ubiquinone/menaquinone biosynthesis C-methylase UbiE